MKLELVLSNASAVVIFRGDSVGVGVGAGDVVRVIDRGERNGTAIRGRLVGFDLGGYEGLAGAVGKFGDSAAAVHSKRVAVLRAVKPAPDEPVSLVDPIARHTSQAVIVRRNLGIDLARAEQETHVLADRGRALGILFPEDEIRRVEQVSLLRIGQDARQGAPAVHPGDRVASARSAHRRRKAPDRRLVVEESQADLLEVVRALDAPGGLAC